MTSRADQDVRDLLGMRSAAAWAMVVVFCGTFLAIALLQADRWTAVAAVLCVLACVGMICLPGDPLPMWSAIALAACAPTAYALVVSPHSDTLGDTPPAWLQLATAAYLVFMCVRGATLWAWVGLLARDVVYVGATASTAQDLIAGIGMTTVDALPLLIATYFAYTIRPTAQSIFRLREQANLKAASESAAAAAVEERDIQLNRLDAIARPLLELIARKDLTDAQRAECKLVEAQLRDRLRAGLIVDDAVAAAARAARSRGVAVMMLDDGGLIDAATTVRDAVRREVTYALRSATTGSVAVRVLPPDREYVATVLVRTGDEEFRAEVSPDGSVRSDLAEIR